MRLLVWFLLWGEGSFGIKNLQLSSHEKKDLETSHFKEMELLSYGKKCRQILNPLSSTKVEFVHHSPLLKTAWRAPSCSAKQAIAASSQQSPSWPWKSASPNSIRWHYGKILPRPPKPPKKSEVSIILLISLCMYIFLHIYIFFFNIFLHI